MHTNTMFSTGETSLTHEAFRAALAEALMTKRLHTISCSRISHTRTREASCSHHRIFAMDPLQVCHMTVLPLMRVQNCTAHKQTRRA